MHEMEIIGAMLFHSLTKIGSLANIDYVMRIIENQIDSRRFDKEAAEWIHIRRHAMARLPRSPLWRSNPRFPPIGLRLWFWLRLAEQCGQILIRIALGRLKVLGS